ncbi:MAG: glycosyltransferase [Gemmataceae bacterium]|nr:glycosyltransferase [Gemmataceae bacterium]
MKLSVLDAGQPWVRSLFSALPAGVTFEAVEPRGPGWTKMPWLAARRTAPHLHGDVAVYTLPHYAPVAERRPDLPYIYYAFDSYENYKGWNPAWVRANEDRLLAKCRAAFAVSHLLADDLRTRTDAPVFVQPNGVTLPSPDDPLPRRPADLPPGPVALCVGQVTEAYDFDLMRGIAHMLPPWQFVYIGDGLKPTIGPNARFLGHRPPEKLAAYMQHADVLFCPLVVSPANHRRSLLRMYDYLTTDRPIVATPIASCVEHAPHVMLADGNTDFATKLLGPHAPIDRARRWAYLEQHTWRHRAELFLRNLGTVVPGFSRAA